jgi:hypothetical protein
MRVVIGADGRGGPMIDRRGDFRRLTLIAVILAHSAGASISLAQEANAPEAGEPVVQQGAWTDDQFYGWVDQIVNGINDRDVPVNGRLDERLSIKLDWIQASCGISEEQKKKLQIAGRRDIKRFLDEMREMKRQYRQVKANPIQFAKLQKRLAEIQTSSAADSFGEASFLSKMLKRTLSDAQNVAYAKAVEESRAFEHRAAVEHAVQFCDLAIGLTNDQRRRLTELFVNETRQMKRKESSELSLQFLMVLQTAKLSRDKLKAIFDAAQWEVMSALLKELQQEVNAVGFGALRMPARVDVFIGEVLLDVRAHEVIGPPAERKDE